jgi:hypothetical protein
MWSGLGKSPAPQCDSRASDGGGNKASFVRKRRLPHRKGKHRVVGLDGFGEASGRLWGSEPRPALLGGELVARPEGGPLNREESHASRGLDREGGIAPSYVAVPASVVGVASLVGDLPFVVKEGQAISQEACFDAPIVP